MEIQKENLVLEDNKGKSNVTLVNSQLDRTGLCTIKLRIPTIW